MNQFQEPGNSSPVVAGDCIWLTGSKDNRCLVSCFNLRNGQKLWERSVEMA